QAATTPSQPTQNPSEPEAGQDAVAATQDVSEPSPEAGQDPAAVASKTPSQANQETPEPSPEDAVAAKTSSLPTQDVSTPNASADADQTAVTQASAATDGASETPKSDASKASQEDSA
ncbi:MAG: hypothetical protein ACPG77_15265, partial [Nannocystaceae bacterium]